MGRLFDVWYKDARQSLPGDAPEKLQDVQRMWIDYRKARCALSYDIYAGGTLAGVVAGQCFLDETVRRATELAALMFNGDGDVSVAAP